MDTEQKEEVKMQHDQKLKFKGDSYASRTTTCAFASIQSNVEDFPLKGIF